MPLEISWDPQILESRSGLSVEGPDAALLERIRDAVEDLPEQERAVVELLMWGRYTKTEAAGMLGCSRSHVRTLWERATVRLEERLGDLF